ncbi:hypothetical protein [Micromonospora chalcea]|uniref:hypothetical protein n=1 Tax=Micromonospora chalcea TaxID=1874 RepID=UPI001CA7322A|nr:hypothetical protein [Micromonospora chalcea]
MSAASSSAKSWLLPVVTATYGYALTKSAESLALLGMAAVLLFSILDANYLRQEKAYRRLYGIVASDAQVVPLFSLDASRAFFAALDSSTNVPDEDSASLTRKKIGRRRVVREWFSLWLPEPQVWLSWSIAPFYGGLFVVGLVIYLSQR